MRIIRKRCLGLDLHKKQITAHLRVHGKTGRAILDALQEGKTISATLIAKLARGSLRSRTAELEKALSRPLTEQQRELLTMLLHAYDSVDAQVAQAELRLEQLMAPHQALVERLDAIPGINPLAAMTLLAETGFDMSVYRDAHQLTALAGLAPGNAISSERRPRISVRKGNVYLKRICVQIAWAASRNKRQLSPRSLQPPPDSHRSQQSHRRVGSPDPGHRLSRSFQRSPLSGSRNQLLPAPRSRSNCQATCPTPYSARLPGRSHQEHALT